LSQEHERKKSWLESLSPEARKEFASSGGKARALALRDKSTELFLEDLIDLDLLDLDKEKDYNDLVKAVMKFLADKRASKRQLPFIRELTKLLNDQVPYELIDKKQDELWRAFHELDDKIKDINQVRRLEGPIQQ
jgi:hypothetical protein